jgi:hypothetical protein
MQTVLIGRPLPGIGARVEEIGGLALPRGLDVVLV